MSPPEAHAAAPIRVEAEEGPVFAAPWEATVFALKEAALASSLFTPAEWADTLGSELSREEASPACGNEGDPGTPYYRAWCRALERLLADKGVASTEAIAERQAAWRRAAAATPHGEPITLDRA